jgi:hypothetical protein
MVGGESGYARDGLPLRLSWLTWESGQSARRLIDFLIQTVIMNREIVVGLREVNRIAISAANFWLVKCHVNSAEPHSTLNSQRHYGGAESTALKRANMQR